VQETHLEIEVIIVLKLINANIFGFLAVPHKAVQEQLPERTNIHLLTT